MECPIRSEKKVYVEDVARMDLIICITMTYFVIALIVGYQADQAIPWDIVSLHLF